MPLETRIAEIINDREQAAAITLLFRLLRETPGLRQWLRAACLDERISRNLDAWIDNRLSAPPNTNTGRRLLAWLAGLDAARTSEAAQLKKRHAAVPTYGGLTRAQLLALIRKHQAGTLALAPFLLIHAWRKTLTDKTATPAAMLATEIFFQGAVATPQKTSLFRQLAHAWEFFEGTAPGAIGRAHFGHAAWWQLNMLLYILAHPKPAYRTREFVRHLAILKIPVDTADTRRFCRKYGIARDSRPGRPRQITALG